MPRKKGVYVPITWHTVPWRYSSSRPWSTLGTAKEWCRTNVGVERADWEYQPFHGRFRFRDIDHAVMFQLTWT